MICGLSQRMEILYSMHRSIYTTSIMISTGMTCCMKIKTRLGQSQSHTLYMAENKSARTLLASKLVIVKNSVSY